MDNIQPLLDFLDENEIECVTDEKEIIIYRNYAQVRISFNEESNEYRGVLEGNGVSSFFFGDELLFDYDDNLKQFEIWFRKYSEGIFQANAIYISKEETYM